MSQRIITDGQYRRATVAFRAAADKYLSDGVDPEIKAEAARITARDIGIAKQLVSPLELARHLAAIDLVNQARIAELEAGR